MNLSIYIDRQREWSEQVFGHSTRAEGICKHIEKELGEIRASPHDLMEWVDVVILALDGAWRAGYTSEEICAALEQKHAINFARDWPHNVDETLPVEHVKA